jgi:competence protein ComEC
MPLEAASLFFDLAGLGAPLWHLTGMAIDGLLWLAHAVGSASGAVATLASMPGWSFGLMIAGGLWFCLWTSRARLAGFIPFAVGASAAFASPVPDLLVTGDGKHMAVVANDGVPRILRSRSGDFIRQLLAESSGFDGDPSDLESATFADCSKDACVADVVREGRTLRILATRSANWFEWPDLVRGCSEADIVISDRRLPRGCAPRWLKLDRNALSRTGGVAIYLDGSPHLRSVAEEVGEHPWGTERADSSIADPVSGRREGNAGIRDRAGHAGRWKIGAGGPQGRVADELQRSS